MTASFWTSSSVKVCTADRFERRAEGKAEGFDRVVIVLAEVSVEMESTLSLYKVRHLRFQFVPLFSVPHTSHFNMAFSLPVDPSKRFPQSVQNTSDPMAAIARSARVP